MAKVIKITDDGLKKLEEELEYLKTEGRADIAEKIKVARGYGDLSENSEYDEAKNEQAKIEARIVEIEAMLKNVEIIEDVKGNTKSVIVGVKAPRGGRSPSIRVLTPVSPIGRFRRESAR